MYLNQKEVDGESTYYEVEGKKIILEQKGNIDVYYMYENKNDIIGLNYNGEVLSIKDKDGNDIREDLNHIGNINPFRYRSYYYDKETSLYYLNSRYYNPIWGRFINADGALGVNADAISYNLYAYCSNNPVNHTDIVGYGWFNNLTKWVEKTVNDIVKTVSNIVNTVKNAFVLDVGVGVGFGGSTQLGPVKAQASAYKDMNWGISNSTPYKSTTTSAAAAIEVKKNKAVGVGIEITHINDSNWEHNNPMVMPWEVWNCPNTSKNILIFDEYSNFQAVELSRENTFIGISFEAHIIFGGHVKIGFNIE